MRRYFAKLLSIMMILSLMLPSLPIQASATVSRPLPTLAAGYQHALAVMADGTVRAWGWNAGDQLGTPQEGDVYSIAAPVTVPGLSGVIAVAGGNNYSLALKSDGTVWAWGQNDAGVLGAGAPANSSTPLQISGLTGVISISAGRSHALALKDDGTVWAWGYGYYGQLGNGNHLEESSSATPVRSGTSLFPLSGVVAISASGDGFYSLALKNDGTVYSWGSNQAGTLGLGDTTNRIVPTRVPGLSGITRISAGRAHALAVDGAGRVWAWGGNTVAGSDSMSTFGNNSTASSTTPVQVSAEFLSGIADVSAGGAHSLFLKTSGTVLATGFNESGQLGDGSTENSKTPVYVSGLAGIVSISAGGEYSLALAADGTVQGWGNNLARELGIDDRGAYPYKEAPVVIVLPEAVLWPSYASPPASSVCEIDGMGYSSFENALAAVDVGQTATIKLLADISYDQGITVNAAQHITFDLNEHNLTVANASGVGLSVSNGSVGYTGPGAFNVTGTFVGVLASGSVASAEVTNATAAIGGSVGASAVSGGAVTVRGDASGGSIGIRADGDGSIAVVSGDAHGTADTSATGAYAGNGGLIAVTGDVDGLYKGAYATGAGSQITVGGDVLGIENNSFGASAENGGSVIVTGCAQGAQYAAYAASDGTVTAAGSATATRSANGWAAYVESGGDIEIGGDAVVQPGCTGVYATGGGTVTVDGEITNGGTAKAAYYIRIYNTVTSTPVNFTGDAAERTEPTTKSGYFTYSADGSTVWVKTAEASVCRIGTANYPSLDGALDEVNDGEAITLLADIDDNDGLVVDNGKSFTLDLNGHTLDISNPSTGSIGLIVQNGSAVTLTDSGMGGAFTVSGSARGVSVWDDGYITVTGVSVSGEDTVAVEVFDGEVTVNGDVSAAGIGCTGIRMEGPGSVTVNGDVHTTGGGCCAAYIKDDNDSEGGILTVAGTVTSEGAGVIVNFQQTSDDTAATLGSVEAWGDGVETHGAKVRVLGDVTSDEGRGVIAYDGSEVAVDGDIAATGLGCYGVQAEKGGMVTVSGDVAAAGNGSCGVWANGGEITVLGNITASVTDPEGYSVGAMAYDDMDGSDGGSVFIGGNVTAIGAESDGVYVGDGGEITIDGTLTGGKNYINISGQIINQGDWQEFPEKQGYYTYTYTSGDEGGTVWIKMPYTVTGVTVSPAAATVQKGHTQAFTAAVGGTNSPPQTVTWSVYGHTSGGTSINPSGLLTVAADESAAALTVNATSVADDSKSGTATVTVTVPAVTTYTVTFNNNGAVYTTKTVNAGEGIGSANWPTDPTRSSYSFGGWFTGENGTGTQFDSTTPVNATMTVYAKWTYSGGGGGKGGGNNPPTPATPTYNAGVKASSGTETALPVTVDKDAGTASIEVGSQELTQGGTVITLPSIPDVDTYSFGIPVPDLSATVGNGTLTLNTEVGSVTIPSNMLRGIAGVSGNKAEISIGQGDKSDLPDDVKAAIGNRPLVQLTLSIDGKQTDWNNPGAPVTVSVPYTPTAEELNNPDSIVVWYIDGSGKVATIPNGHYDAATGTVTFQATHFSDYAVAYNKVSFHDVAAGAWYGKAVAFIAARDITSGTGNSNYSPEAKLTRGEFIVLMMRAYGIAPDTNPTDNFSDAGSTYYTGYLAAAKQLGITAGVGNNMFAPGKEITRQEMFTLLYNALKVIGQLPQGDSGKTVLDFTDAGQIDSWAQDAMTLLVETGTVGGSGGKLTPTGTTTRAEMAQVLYNLLGK